MNIYDLIFWYTGAGAWAIIAVATLLGIAICFILAMLKAYHLQRQWIFYKVLCERKDIEILRQIVYKVGMPNNMKNEDFLKWLEDMHEAYEKAKKEKV